VTYYVGILDAGGGGAWGVRIPDVPGCHGGGASAEAAIADAIGALREVAAHHAAKGTDLKSPRTTLEILRDKAADYDPTVGETFVMIPLVLDQARSVKANISLDAGLLEAIDDEAKLRGLTRSSFLASAARDKIARRSADEYRHKGTANDRSRRPTIPSKRDSTPKGGARKVKKR
jgi:predicted RNase H-like HicB family nuclease